MDDEPFPSSGHRRLTRSRRERMWTGVCGGLAEYFDVDPVLVRLFWVVATILTAGLGVVAYFCLAIIMPPDEREWGGETSSASLSEPGAAGVPGGAAWSGSHYDYRQRRRTGGIILIGLGIIFLLGQAGFFHWIQWNFVWPAILIIIGLALLARRDWRS